jgi:hypothetical protein
VVTGAIAGAGRSLLLSFLRKHRAVGHVVLKAQEMPNGILGVAEKHPLNA